MKRAPWMQFLLVPLLLSAAASAMGPQPKASGPWTTKVEQGTELFATFDTSEGKIVVRLFSKDAPRTVANFVGLATGEQPWTDPQTNKEVRRPLYRDVIFHRVIPGFMIQGGDPTGTGMGSPGYRFADEFESGRTFDKPGILAMANSGPGTNGSQFFITTGAPAHLNGRHTIFGEVVEGYDNVVKISEVERGHRDRPVKPVVIKSIAISDKAPKSSAKGEAAKKPAKRKAAATQAAPAPAETPAP